eukprot:jgi/Botrbrau1/15291/Bobra.0371s0001.1
MARGDNSWKTKFPYSAYEENCSGLTPYPGTSGRKCMQFWSGDEMKTPEDIYEQHKARRRGILLALTQDVDEFYNQCDPERDNLCLYGTSEGTWRVDLPAQQVPAELPEPTLGINFPRDAMQKEHWLALVAVHSDTWLISVAFYYGAELNKEGREKLFQLINELPTCYEVVTGKAKDVKKEKVRKRPLPESVPPPLGYPKRQGCLKGCRECCQEVMGPRENRRFSEDDEEDADVDDEQNLHRNDDDKADGSHARTSKIVFGKSEDVDVQILTLPLKKRLLLGSVTPPQAPGEKCRLLMLKLSQTQC